MSALAKRKLYLAAAALFLGAIAAQVLAKHHVGHGMMAAARAVAVPAARLALQAAAAWHVRRSGLWDVVSLGFAAIAVGFWAASRKRHEPGPQWVPLGLLCFYGLLLILIA